MTLNCIQLKFNFTKKCFFVKKIFVHRHFFYSLVPCMIPLSSLKTPYRQTFTHFLQPVQFSEFLKTMCLCHKKLTLPITCFGQALTHSQQALQFLLFAQIWPVKTFFNLLFFILLLLLYKINKNLTLQKYIVLLRTDLKKLPNWQNWRLKCRNWGLNIFFGNFWGDEPTKMGDEYFLGNFWGGNDFFCFLKKKSCIWKKIVSLKCFFKCFINSILVQIYVRFIFFFSDILKRWRWKTVYPAKFGKG